MHVRTHARTHTHAHTHARTHTAKARVKNKSVRKSWQMLSHSTHVEPGKTRTKSWQPGSRWACPELPEDSEPNVGLTLDVASETETWQQQNTTGLWMIGYNLFWDLNDLRIIECLNGRKGSKHWDIQRVLRSGWRSNPPNEKRWQNNCHLDSSKSFGASYWITLISVHVNSKVTIYCVITRSSILYF